VIDGDLSFLSSRHVTKIMERKGYTPVVHALFYHLTLLDNAGVPWLLKQHGSSYNSWSLWIDGSPIVHLRALRPYDGAITLLTAYRGGKLSARWRDADAVTTWFGYATAAVPGPVTA
jgi:hypothetical protein